MCKVAVRFGTGAQGEWCQGYVLAPTRSQGQPTMARALPEAVPAPLPAHKDNKKGHPDSP